MRKLLIAFTLILCMLVSSGCYVTKAAKIKDIVGTYKLTSYTDDGVDLIAKRGITAYLVITNDGTNYYYYKEEGREALLREIKVAFIPDEEEQGKYSYVEYRINAYDSAVKFAYAFDGLNATAIRVGRKNGEIYTYQIYTKYEKVNSAKDLSFLKKELGEIPQAIEYGKSMYHGIFSHQFQDYYNSGISQDYFNKEYVEPFVYWYIDVNVITQKATVYYMLKADEKPVVEERSFTMTSRASGGYDLIGLYPVDSREAYVYKGAQSGTSYSIYLYVPEAHLDGENTYYFYQAFTHGGYYFDLEYQMQARIDWYNSTKEPTE